MIEYNFISSTNRIITQEECETTKQWFEDYLGDMKKEFDDANAFAEINVDTRQLSVSAANDIGALINRFQQYHKGKESS